MERYWIWLATRKGLSRRGSLRVLAAYTDPEQAYRAALSGSISVPGLSAKGLAALRDTELSAALRIMEQCRESGIGILCYGDPRYPELLRQIADPPMVLYYKGTLPDFDGGLPIAVVGRRDASASARKAAAQMGQLLGAAGCTVLSGCAAGIDCAAMEGALRSGAAVVGVLGCGADVVYPSSSAHLYRDVPEQGCLITEYAPGTPPDRWNFPARNRILSGLSRGVVVVEASKRSGALITARHALEQGRDVFALPGTPGDPGCAGSNDLLRQGASFAENGTDVILEYLSRFPERVQLPTGQELSSDPDTYINTAGSDTSAEKNTLFADPFDKKDIDKRKSLTYIDVQETASALPPEEAAVLLSLAQGPQPIDQIVNATGLAAQTVLCALTMLEIRGLILRLPGGNCALK